MLDPTQSHQLIPKTAHEVRAQSSGDPQITLSATNQADSAWNSWNSWDWSTQSSAPGHKQSSEEDSQKRSSDVTSSRHQHNIHAVAPGNNEFGSGDKYSNDWDHTWYDSPVNSLPGHGTHLDHSQAREEHEQFVQSASCSPKHNHHLVASPNADQLVTGHLSGQTQQQLDANTDNQEQAYHHYVANEQHDRLPSYFEQSCEADVWSVASTNQSWSGHHSVKKKVPGESLNPICVQEEIEVCHLQATAGTESIPQVSCGADWNSDHELTRPTFQVLHSDGDLGTACSFFNQDEDDGDVQRDTHKHSLDGGLTREPTASSSDSSQFLTVTRPLHRSNSEISNASLATLNLSMDEDEDQEPLHNIQELVQRMAEGDRFHGEASSSFVQRVASGHVNLEQADHDEESILDQDSGAELGAQSPARQYDTSHSQHSNYYLTEQKPFLGPEVPMYNQLASTESVSLFDISAQGELNFDNHPSTREHPYIQNSTSDCTTTSFPDQSGSGITITVGHENLLQEARLTPNARDQSLSGTAPPLLDVLNSKSSIRRSHSDTLLIESATHESSNQRSRSPCVPTINTNDKQVKAVIPPVKTSPASSLTSLPQTAAILPLPEKNVTPQHTSEDLDGSRPDSTPDVHQSSGLQISSALNYPTKTANSEQANQKQPMNKIRTSGANPPNNKLFSSPSAEDGNCVPKPEPELAAWRTASIHPPEELPIRSSSRNSDEIAAANSRSLKHHSTFQSSGRSHRSTMSPATTLWDNSKAPTANILLAPILPLIIPNLNTQSPVPATSGTENVTLFKESETHSKSQYKPYLSVGGQEPGAKHQEYQGKLSSGSSDRNRSFESSDMGRRNDRNRSYDSLDELDAVVDRQREKSEYNHRHNSQDFWKHDSYRRDLERPASKTERPLSRSGQYRYERPLSRAGEIHAREDRHRHHGYYGDYGNSTFDERYDRPRSGQDELLSSRPSSRSSREMDQHKSKSSLDRNKEYYYKDRNRGYSYDNFGRQMDYSQEERERYYRCYQEKDARYTRGYYEEYYGAKHADYLLGQQPQRRPRSSQSLDRSDSQLTQQQQRRPHSTQSFGRSSPHSQLDRSATSATSSPKKLHSSSGTKIIGQDYYGHRDYHSNHYLDYYSQGGYPYRGYGAPFDSYGYDPYIYGYHYPTYDEYIKGSGHNQGRMTPPKYLFPHVRASFGPAGQLIKVLPNRPTDGQPAVVELQDVHGILEDSPEADELKSFPGPLTRALTHKKDVLLFCQQKARDCADNVCLLDRDSAQLIWNFLALLIKQNGSVVGTDLSDLLLEGHEPSTHDYNTRGLRISQSPETQDSVTDGNSEGSSVRASPAIHVTSDRTVINSFDREMDKWVDRFRSLLFYGRKKDALECAMRNHLWGHALFLASKMDARTHANVMTRFANSAIKMNDPLQTLYQLMSGRQPAAVTGVVDERWGDWRPHLAMILSNQTSRPDLDRRSLTTLGDTLGAKGCLHASHFCYLMAQVNFGSYMNTVSKIVLVGSSHSLPLQEFATNEAIQCTEVYEYAQTLNNPDFCMPHFQIFKYLYACRLADYGMVSEALQYCEVIAGNIQKYPRMFHSTFVQLVYTLSSKLKYCDPQRQISADDAEDAAWLQQLANMSAAFDDGSIRPMSNTPRQTGLPDISSFNENTQSGSLFYSQIGNSAFVASDGDLITGTSTYPPQQQEHRSGLSGENYGETSRAEDLRDGVVVFDQQQQQLTQEQSNQSMWLQQQQQQQDYTQEGYYLTEHQQQYVNSRQETNSQLDIQPQKHSNEYPTQQHSIQQHPTQQQSIQQYATEQQHLTQKHNLLQTQYPTPQHPTHQHLTPQQELTQHPIPQQELTQRPTHPHLPPPMTQEPLPQSQGLTSTQTNLATGLTGHVFSPDPSTAQFPPTRGTLASTQALPQAQLQQQKQQGNYDNQWSQYRNSVSATDTDEEEEEEEGEDADFSSSLNGFDYFGSTGAQKVVTPPHRYRHMSGSSTGSVRRKRTTSESSTSSIRTGTTGTHRTVPQQQQQQQLVSGGRGNSQITQTRQRDNEGSGWLGGLFNKFKARGKNEMILPDDKNPSIVWDPVKKKWMNADGTEEEQVSTAPPPKDTELKGPGKPPSFDPTPMALGPPPPPVSGANRFSLKAKGNRGPYVDVTKPKPASVPPDLFNLLPGTTAPTSTDGHNPLLTSNMFHPPSGSSSSNKDSNLLAVPGSADQRISDMSSLNAPAGQAPSIPPLFDPASLNSSHISSSGRSSGNQSVRPGRRREYPK